MADDLRSSARALRFWCTLLILFVVAVMVFELGARAAAFGGSRVYHRLGLDLLFSVPILFYIFALVRVRQALGAIAGGALFTPEIAGAMRHVGLWLAIGSLTTLAIAPLLHRLAAEDYPRLVEFDVANLVIGAVGLALMFIARIFDQAVRLQREMDDIF